MKCVQSVLVLLIMAFISAPLFSQDLSGIWRGTFGSGTSKMLSVPGYLDRYKFEVQLDQNSKKFTGVTYSYKTTVFYGKATCKGTINPETKLVYLEELKIVEVRMAMGSDACVMTCFLKYSKVNDEEFLEGTFYSTNTNDSSNCGKGWVMLRKVSTSDFYKEPFIIRKEAEKEMKKQAPLAKKDPPNTPPVPKKPEVKKEQTPVKKPTPKPPVTPEEKKPESPQPKVTAEPKITQEDTIAKTEKRIPKKITPKELRTRTNELVKTIYTNAREISVNLYDNGTIDNDTISVYLNNELVINKQRLTEKPITFTFNIDESDDEHEVVMVAENLGEIPPNTSLMIVRAGDKRYEVRITSTEQKNAVVVFKFDPDQQ